MDDLILLPSPRLVRRAPPGDDDEAGGLVADEDLTSRAVEFLFEPVRLDPGVRLVDIFRLFDACPLLLQVFRRDFAAELVEEARKGALPQSAKADPPAVAGIESLELYWSWTLDTSTSTFGNTHRLDLHGIGKALQVDAPEYGAQAGDRINWSVSLTPVRELLDLPVRIREELTILEDDIDSSSYGEPVQRAILRTVTLGQMMHGILHELSFHGGPQQQEEFLDELLRRKREVDEGTAELIPADEVFPADMHAASIDAMFVSLGGVSPRDVVRSMRLMEDEQAAGEWFDDEFGGAVVVRDQFRSRPGREFRKLFRAAGR